MRILLLLWGHLCCSIFWFDGSLTLNIKICRWRAAVADICWYWWARYFCIVKKMPPDFLYWRHLKHLPLILPLRFLYWRFHKRHEYPLRCLHLVLRKVIKILAFTKSVFKSFRTIFSITRLKTSPIPITLTPVCLSKTISLQVKNA